VLGTLKSLPLALLLACSLAPRCLAEQIAPIPDTAVAPAAPADATQIHESGSGQDAPKAFVSGWSLNSEVASTPLTAGGAVSLDPSNLELILFFGSTPPSSSTEFRYRLSDYDNDWTVTREHIAHYRRLPPGHYRFEVQARIVGRPWQSAMATLAVVRRPFFYQTWYFYLLVLLGLVILAAQLLSQRDQLLKGQMGIVLEERNRIASDCHDTLMAGFAAISWQLEATAKLFRDVDASETPAAKSCDLARSMVAHCQAEARRIIWDLRDSEELTNMLSLALSRAITTHRLRDSIEATLDVHGNEIPIAPGAVHHLVCIGQEAVTNAMRHADASAIQIALRYESDSLSLSIRDNGRGFQTSSSAIRTGHFGIPVMEERARKLGGTLRLNSAEGSGTEVAVTVSFQSINQPASQQHHVVPWIGV
jgi:signal transduction histidine kinase